jgi:UDPglucose 6-dehydrogenase
MVSEKLAVIGCGKLGAPLVACLAKAGHLVVGIDINENLIQNLKSRKILWQEPNLVNYLETYKDLINFTSNFDENLQEVTTTFIIVPTPSDSNGVYSIDFVLSAVKNLCEKINETIFESHTIVIVSTVMPGDTEGRITDAVKLAAGENFERFKICYSPEFIALGSVIYNIENPDMILIGQSDETVGSKLEKILSSMTVNTPIVLRLTTAEAEIAKIAINSFVTTKISFSNQISEICENFSNTSSVNVLKAIGTDSRIGNSYLKQGTSYGGPCFPRDNRAFAKFAESLGISLDLALAADSINNRQNHRLSQLLNRIVPSVKNILVVGFSYKPDTDVYEESPALSFIKSSLDYQIYVLDEHIKGAKNFDSIKFIENSDLSRVKIDVAILFVPAVAYSAIPNDLDEGVILIDYWGLWSKYKNLESNNYIKIGDYLGR